MTVRGASAPRFFSGVGMVEIVAGWRPGLVGAVVREHGEYYAREWKFGSFFEAKVAQEMGAFVARYGARDALLSAWEGGVFLGSLTIDGGDAALPAGMGHLRWFIMTDAARGKGVGRLLVEAGMGFLRGGGFSACYLTTFAGLDAARRLYEGVGFRLTKEAAAESWGTRVVEQEFVWQV